MTARAIERAAKTGAVSDAGRPARAMLYAAPLAAAVAGMAAQWLDFRTLRVPLLLLVLAGVFATCAALTRGRGAGATLAICVLGGALTWSGAQVLYSVLHVAAGEQFSFSRLDGPQPVQALGLIVAHAAFLGLPTGIAASVALLAARRTALLR